MDDDMATGPIDYVIVEWPKGSAPNGEAFPHLLDLVDRGLIRILDLSFIQKDTDGNVAEIDIVDLDLDGNPDLAVFIGARSGIVDDEDHAEAAAALEDGTSAAILVYENVWAAPFAAALLGSGAQLVARGPVPLDTIIETLDELEASGA